MTGRKKPYVIGMVPAKLGSTRLPAKNLALLNGKPLIAYAIDAAKRSGAFDRIVINAEDAIFSRIARRYGVDFYLRPRAIVSPTTKTDTVVYDFLKKNPCDIVAWVSSIAPLQPAEEVRRMVDHFVKEKLDSLMTVKEEQVHCVYKGKPVNFKFDEIFAQTQDLTPVGAYVYSVMMWRSSIFMRTFARKGYALLCGKAGHFPVSKESAIIIKRQEDLVLAGNVLRSRGKGLGVVKYDNIIRLHDRHSKPGGKGR